MWTPKLFNAMARLARPGGTLATFTSAGFVRRGLQEAGFSMQKCKGFGRKREMLRGVMEQTLTLPTLMPWFSRQGSKNARLPSSAAGLPAHCFRWRCCAAVGRSHSIARMINPLRARPATVRGALYPLLSKHDTAINFFFPAAFTFARRLYDALPVEFEHDWCGVTQLGWDDKSQQKIAQMLSLDLPSALASAVDAEQARQLTGVETDCGGVTYPLGAGCARRN